MPEAEIYNKETGEIFAISDGLAQGAVLSETALVLPEAYSQEQWADLGHKLGSFQKSSMWWIGDWVRFGYRKQYGQTWEQFQRITGLSRRTLQYAHQVAERFETRSRLRNLDWAHHQEVVSLPPDQAFRILEEAADQYLSTREVRALASQQKALNRLSAHAPSADTCAIADLQEAVSAGRKFGCIYADPPWIYDNQGTRGATGDHYEGLTVEELRALPVGDLAATDAHLHLWTTNGFLFECPKLFEAWGFTFKSSFVWVKPDMGMGNYWRNAHEILLTAVRGKATSFADHSMISWIKCARSAHSEKPWEVRDLLRKASPGPYLEMFARTEHEGWTPWGNQIERSLFARSFEAQPTEDAA